MGTTLFVIFSFGLVISGIVFLGVQQAAEWAKGDASQNIRTHTTSNHMDVLAPAPLSPEGRPLPGTHRP